MAQAVRVWTCVVQNVTGFEPQRNPLLCVGDSSPRTVSVHSCNLLIGYKWSKRAMRSYSNSSECNDKRPKRRQIVFLGKVYENWNSGGSQNILVWCSSEVKHSYDSCARSRVLIRQPMNSSASTALISLCTKRHGFCRSCSVGNRFYERDVWQFFLENVCDIDKLTNCVGCNVLDAVIARN